MLEFKRKIIDNYNMSIPKISPNYYNYILIWRESIYLEYFEIFGDI